MEQVSYRFDFKDHEPLSITLDFAPRTYLLSVPDDAPRPAWTELGCNRCSNCTLPPTATHCPTALGFSLFLPHFEGRVSYESVTVTAITANRTIAAATSLQAGLASIMGLVSATSGCPRTRFLRPLARFHLPFADERETLFRVFSAWLLTGYVHARLTGKEAPASLDGLKHLYAELSVVNGALAERLRTVATRDALLNAVLILDIFAQIAPFNIEGQLEDILSCLMIEE